MGCFVIKMGDNGIMPLSDRKRQGVSADGKLVYQPGQGGVNTVSEVCKVLNSLQ